MSIKIVSTRKKTFTAVIMMLFCAVLLSVFSRHADALTTLAPGDLYIVSVNSDSSYPGGANSNGFDFVSRVNLDPGTEIYFADKGWDGSLGTPFWRSGTGEGVLRYTVPAGGITAGTIVRYDDTMIPTLPSSGSGTWDMYSINSVTGALTLTTSIASGFDPANAGDNILVFQGTAASPSFLFGIGWSAATTWISSGTPTSNNSWIPSSLSAAAGTIVSLGSQDNFQYNCASLGLFSSGFSSSLQTSANWNVNDVTPYAGSPCSFDAVRPVATISQSFGQNDPTNSNWIYFEITFDQAIDPFSFTASDIIISGSGSGSVMFLSTFNNITWGVAVLASGEGTITISLPTAAVTDNNLNPNNPTVVNDDTVLYDITPPASLATPDMIASSDSGSLDTDDITSNTTPSFSGTCTDNDVIELWVDGAAISPTAVCIGSTYSITPVTPLAEGVRSITVFATDLTGNVSVVSNALQVTIDTVPPSCYVYTTSGFSVSPEINGYTDDPAAVITVTIDGNNYTAVNSGGNWTVASGTISPNLTIDQTYPISVSCLDVAGNTNINNSGNYNVLRHVDMSVGIQLLNTGTILSGNSVTYRVTLTNTDPLYPVIATGVNFYNLVPTALTPPATVGNIFTTSNPDIQCFNIGDVTGIGDPFWSQYAGNIVLQCGFTSPITLVPGGTQSYDVMFTANTDLPDGLTNRILIYDENQYDPDSDTLNETANAEGDAFGLALNSVSRATYVKPAPVVVPPTPPVLPADNELVNTGKKILIPVLASATVMGVAIFITKKSKQK